MNKKNILPTGIYLSKKPLGFNKIFDKFAKTKYGETLRSNIRFSEFKPQNISNDEWVEMLGRDVNNLFHLSVSLNITRSFLSQCSSPTKTWQKHIPQTALFTSEQQTELLFTAVTHDWAEAIIGDIPLTSKKDTDENMEMIILRKLIHEILGEKIEKHKIDRLTNNVHTILTDKNTKLGKAFNAIERMGYVKTGIKAWHLSQGMNNEMGKKLRHLAIRVFLIHTPHLIEYAKIYPPVYYFLIRNNKPISDVFINIEYQKPLSNPSADVSEQVNNLQDSWLKFIETKNQ